MVTLDPSGDRSQDLVSWSTPYGISCSSNPTRPRPTTVKQTTIGHRHGGGGVGDAEDMGMNQRRASPGGTR